MAYKIFGAICLGSVEQELAIYEIRSGGDIRIVERATTVLPLFSDTFGKGRISIESLDSLCEMLEKYASVLKAYKADGYKAYATVAVREAENCDIILDRIKVRTGIEVELISNSEQRYLNYKAVALNENGFNDVIKSGTLILDTGYGSLQFSIFDNDALISTENIALGAGKILSDLSRARIADDQMLDRAEEMVNSELLNYKKLYLKGLDIETIFGIGENILYKYWAQEKPELLRRAVPAERIIAECRHVMGMKNSEITEILGSAGNYARLLPIAAIYYKRIIEITGAKKLFFPCVNFTDGMAVEYAEKVKLYKSGHDFEADIISESRNMAKRYRCDTSHSAVVEEYALLIFDAVKKFSGLSKRDRLMLQIAAILHDCGKFVSIKNVDECGYFIVLSTEIIGLSHAERKMIAGVVRVRNTASFDYELAAESGDPIRLAKLSAILCLANALDRGHVDKLRDTKVALKEKSMELSILASYDGDLTLERLAVDENSVLFAEVFGLKPVFRQKKRI